MLVSHRRQFGTTVFLLGLTFFRSSGLRGDLLFIGLGKLILRNRCPDGELGNGSSLGSHRRLFLNRVDQGRRQRLVVGIGPLRLRDNLLDVFAKEDVVILDVLLSDDSFSVGDLGFRLFDLFFTLTILLALTRLCSSVIRGLRLILDFLVSSILSYSLRSVI